MAATRKLLHSSIVSVTTINFKVARKYSLNVNIYLHLNSIFTCLFFRSNGSKDSNLFLYWYCFEVEWTKKPRDANIFPTMDLVLFTKQLLTVRLYWHCKMVHSMTCMIHGRWIWFNCVRYLRLEHSLKSKRFQCTNKIHNEIKRTKIGT